jgi:GntR family transcriptional regulator
MPVYVQITDYLRKQLTDSGAAEPGRLPTEAELIRMFGVSRQTARRAYADLVAEGLVQRSPGRGSFPARTHRYLMSVGSLDDLLAPEEREFHVVAPMTSIRNSAAATKLGLPGDEVGFVAYSQIHEGVPFGLVRMYLPPRVAQVLSGENFLFTKGGIGKEPVVAILNRKLQFPIAMAKQLIAAIAAPADVAQIIECEPNQPILQTEFLFFDTDARPVQLNVNFYHPERYEYRTQLQRRPKFTVESAVRAVTRGEPA